MSPIRNTPELRIEEPICVAPVAQSKVKPKEGLWSSLVRVLPGSGVSSVLYSFADQGFAVGGTFLANVVLARSQSKQEYGMFVLSYSVFTFLSGLHNSAILEPYTVYGSGRYRERFSRYLRLMVGMNATVGLLLSVLVLATSLGLHWAAPQLVSGALLGMGVTVGILLSGSFLRRVFYLQRQPWLAARASVIYFGVVVLGLLLTKKAHVLNGFSVFLILAVGWITAGTCLHKRLRLSVGEESFLDSEPGYWREHWKYSRWVFGASIVYQITTQGYYWLVAGYLSMKEVGELRAMHLLVVPMDQIFIALSLLLMPALASRYAAKKIKLFLSLWKQFSFGVVALTVLFALAIRVVGKPAMHILYAGKFDGLSSVLYVLAFLPLLLGLVATMSSALNSAERPKLVFCAYAASGVMTIVGGIPLVMRYGLQGAAYGMLLSAATCALALMIGLVFTVYKRTTPLEEPVG